VVEHNELPPPVWELDESCERVRLKAMSLPSRKWVLIASIIALPVLVSLQLFAEPSSPQKLTSSSQPKISWSVNQIGVILSPGESTSRILTITSTRGFVDADIEAVPEIAGFLSIQPSAFANVLANQPQQVTVNFAIPSDATLGTFEGTIHVRTGTQTLPQTLKLELKIWPSISRNGVEIKFPPLFTPVEADTQVRFVNSSTPTLPPLFGFSVYSPAIRASGTIEETLQQIAVDRLGAANILSFGVVSNGGLLVRANTFNHNHFFWFDPQSGRAVEVVEGQNGFFSSSEFEILTQSLHTIP